MHWQGAVVGGCGAQASVSLGLDVAHKGDENTQPTTSCTSSRYHRISDVHEADRDFHK